MKFFLYALTVLFIGLKLTDHIDWSWWLVLAPIIYMAVMTFIRIVIESFIEVNMSPFERNLYRIQRGRKPKD